MLNALQKNLLAVIIALAALFAWVFPAPGVAMSGLGLSSPYIFVIFLCQGAAIDARRFREVGHYSRLLLWGFLITFLLAPLLGWLVMNEMGWQGDFRVGFLLMCSMGPTLVSGVVIARQAGGEAEGATLLTIVLNLLAVVMIPITLGLVLGGASALDQGALLRKLLLLVLLPAVIGQAARMLWPALIAARAQLLKYLPLLLLGLIIYVSLAEQNRNLHEMQIGRVLALALASLAVHLVLLIIGFAGASRVLRAGSLRATSLAFVCSQKTLPVAVAVWAGALAQAHPLAILPPIVFHMTQIATDGLLAGWWSQRAHEKAAPADSAS